MSERLEVELVPVDDLEPWPGNPKEHDLDEIRASIRRHGFVAPVVADRRTGRVVAGHGRREAVQAMRAAGEPPPGRVEVVGDVWRVPCVWVDFADDLEAEAFLVGDNRLSVLGGWADPELAAVLDRLRSEPGGLVGVGYRDDEVASVVSAHLRRPPPDTFPTVEEGSAEIETCPRCGEEFEP